MIVASVASMLLSTRPLTRMGRGYAPQASAGWDRGTSPLPPSGQRRHDRRCVRDSGRPTSSLEISKSQPGCAIPQRPDPRLGISDQTACIDIDHNVLARLSNPPEQQAAHPPLGAELYA